MIRGLRENNEQGRGLEGKFNVVGGMKKARKGLGTYRGSWMEGGGEKPASPPTMYSIKCCEHVVYMLCTCCVHVVYMFGTCGVHVGYMWCTWSVHVVYIGCTCCVHVQGRGGELKCYRHTDKHTDPPTKRVPEELSLLQTNIYSNSTRSP